MTTVATKEVRGVGAAFRLGRAGEPVNRSVLAFVIAAICMPGSVRAYCVGSDTGKSHFQRDFYSVTKEFRRSQYVAVVRVRRETRLGDDGKPRPRGPAPRSGFDSPIGALYDVDVVKLYRGAPVRRLTLYTENSSGRAPMVVGQKYLTFTSPESFETVGTFQSIDNCGNSAVVTAGSKTLGLVQHLAGPLR